MSQWHGRLKPTALEFTGHEQNDPYYVDLDAWKGSDGVVHRLRGRSAVDTIFDSIDVTAMRQEKSTHLFAGFPGTGKTTELNRLARKLSDATHAPGYSVLRINAKRYHGMSEALSMEEMAILLTAGIGEAALETLGDTAFARLRKQSIWDRIYSRIEANAEAKLNLGVADIKFALKRGGTTLRDKLRVALGQKVEAKLRELLHELVLEIAQGIYPRRLVVLVDELEKFTVATPRVTSVYQQMADLFIQRQALLELPNCHTIYTIPPYLAFLNPGLAVAFDGAQHLLPTVKVRSRPPERDKSPQGIEALTKIVAARVDLETLFGVAQSDCMELLALASGGHMRDLFNLLRDVVVIGMRQSLPLSTNDVTTAIDTSRAQRGNLLRDDLDILLKVSKSGDIGLVDEEQLGAFAGVMDQHLMLCYSNGDFWFDAHPIVAHKLEQAREARGSGPADD